MKRMIVLGVLILIVLGHQVQAAQWGVAQGQQAPDFTASNYQGKDVVLSEFFKDGPVVLIFYRGSWCPYCNVYLQSFQSKIEEFKALKATIVAVSVDQLEKASQTVNTKAFDLQVISDPKGEILKLYNQVFQVPQELVEKYKNEYQIDLEAASGETHHQIAIPGTYVIDPQGIVVFASVNEDYKVRVAPEVVLEELKKCKSRRKTDLLSQTLGYNN